MQRTLSIGGVSTFLFGNPNAEINVDPKHKRLVPIVGIYKVKSLTQEVCRERDARMVDLVRPVVKAGCCAVVGKNLGGDMVDGGPWARWKLDSVGAMEEIVVEEGIAARALRWDGLPNVFAAVP